MKKQTCLLMLIGALCMSYQVFTRSFFTTPESIADFIRGFGVSIIISSFILEQVAKKTCKVKRSIAKEQV